MKTAISIPDSLFMEANELASKLGLSRSELYAKALSDLLESYRDQAITAKLNEVYAQESSAPDPVMTQLQFASLEAEEW